MSRKRMMVLTTWAVAMAAFVAVPAAEAGVSAASAECDGGVTPQRAAAIERDLRARLASRPSRRAGIVTVPVVFHVVHRSDGTANHSDATVAAQIARLNKDFAGQEAPGVAADTGFRFRLAATRRWQNDNWFDNGPDPEVTTAMQVATREGGKSTLNIWSTNIPHGGEATFPWEADRPWDGALIKWTMTPGGSAPDNNQGKVASHEAGHWLGLYHTFDFGCTDEGDLVVDTPAHLRNEDCLTDDTCPEHPGLDPIHNYMNYTGDPCRNQFTRGQATRALDNWTAYRA